MDGDRKYKQRGYYESGASGNNNGGPRDSQQQKPRQQGPRPSIDITGPRLPRLVQTVTASRCFNCSTTLPTDIDFRANCPKCNAPLHCCKQCAHFEPSTRFQCLKSITVRVAGKDLANECELFSPRVTVAREVKSQPASAGLFQANGSLGGNGNGYNQFHGNGNGNGGDGGGGRREPMPRQDDRPRNAQDARAAFDNLFKK